MKILIACEESGTVRDAFIKKGHVVVSCDLKPARNGGPHYEGSVFDIIDNGWDMMIAHPPCTYLTVTGNKWFKEEYKDRFPTRNENRKDAIDFFMKIANANIPKICIENPLGIMSTSWRKPNQIIHPYFFGDEAMKKTCLWLKGLPLLYHNPIPNLFDSTVTHVGKGEQVVFKSGKKMAKWYVDAGKYSSFERSEIRSVTFNGIANAMAEQWG